MFRRRASILLGMFAAIMLVLIARLLQFQLIWNQGAQSVSRGPLQEQTVLETFRGAILARDGEVLVSDEMQFDLAVEYKWLLYDYSQRHGLWDRRMEQVRAHARESGLNASSGNCAVCHLPGGPTTTSSSHLREGKGRCMACHGDVIDWKRVIRQVAELSPQELDERIDVIVGRIERIRADVQRRERERRDIPASTDLTHIRIREEYDAHTLCENVPLETAMMIETSPHRFHGIEVKTNRRRVVHNGTLAPHVVGLTGAISQARWDRLQAEGKAWSTKVPPAQRGRLYRKDDQLGVSGIEAEYEDVLRGTRGRRTETVVFKTLRLDRKVDEVAPEPGYNVTLTLDPDLQRAANEALQWAHRGELQLTRGAIAVIEPYTGDVLAMSTWPTYDLARYREPEYFRNIIEDRLAPLLNRPVAAQLPPGSVFKLVTGTAGLQSGVIRGGTHITCHGSITHGGRRFRCHGPDGSISIVTAIERSCNVFFYKTAERLGGRRLKRHAEMFGFGQETGLDLPAEKDGNLIEPQSLFGVYNMGIGHGRLLVTPLQVARMVAVFANGGHLVTPHLMLRIETASGELVRGRAVESRRLPIESRYIELVREGMARVVDSGTARRSGLSRFSAAGKTGTAELWRGSNLNHVWFAGYAPRHRPRFAFAVVSEKTEGQGGSVAAVIAEKMLALYEQKTSAAP